MIKRKVKIAIMAIVGAVSIGALAKNDVIDEVIWVVGDDAILKSDVEKQVAQMKYEKVDMPGDPYCVIPEQLAIKKLFLNQAKLDSIEPNEGSISMQVDQRINGLIEQMGSQEALENYYGKPLRSLKEELRDQAREQMMVQQVQQKLVASNKLSPSDVRKYYSDKENVDKLPEVPAKVEVEIVTSNPRITPAEVEAIKDKLRSYKQRVESGDATFSMLATLYSDDVESAKHGGELGFMGKGQLVKEFADEAFNLTDPNKVSRIVETEFGFHIIQLIEHKGDKVNCRHILLLPKPSLEEKQQAKTRLDSLSAAIRNNKITFEHAAELFSDDKDTRMNGGLMANPQDGTSQFEYKDLNSYISGVVSNMKVGEISDPFFMKDKNNKDVCVIVKLKSKIDEHKANIDNDYQLLKSNLQSIKNNEIIDNWIREKQKTTYVNINKDWQNCDFQYPNWIKK